MTRMNKKRIAVASIITGATMLIGLISVLAISPAPIKKIVDINLFKRTYSDEEKLIKKHPYLSETTYDGTNKMDMRVFDYSFDNNIGTYKSNSNLYSTYPDAFSVFYPKAKTSADTFFNSILGTGYRTISENRKDYEQALLSVTTEDYIHGVPTNKLAEDISCYVEDNKYQGTASFVSDPSLIWFNDCGYLRGILTLDVYNKEKDASETVYTDNLEVKDKASYIVDLSLVIDDSLNTVKVTDYKIVDRLD